MLALTLYTRKEQEQLWFLLKIYCYMGVAYSQLTGFNMQLTIDQRATQLLNMPYFSSKDKGKNNMRHGIYYGYRIHCASETVTHTNAECGAHCPTCAETVTSCLTQALLDSLFTLSSTYLQPAVRVVFL